MEEYQCPDHHGKPVPTEGWFLVELWANGNIGIIGQDPSHPYCPPIPFLSPEDAEEARRKQKPMCMASGNMTLGALSREKNGLAIAHDVWDHRWLRTVLERHGMKESMLYRLPDGMVENPEELFQANLKRRNH